MIANHPPAGRLIGLLLTVFLFMGIHPAGATEPAKQAKDSDSVRMVLTLTRLSAQVLEAAQLALASAWLGRGDLQAAFLTKAQQFDQTSTALTKTSGRTGDATKPLLQAWTEIAATQDKLVVSARGMAADPAPSGPAVRRFTTDYDALAGEIRKFLASKTVKAAMAGFYNRPREQAVVMINLMRGYAFESAAEATAMALTGNKMRKTGFLNQLERHDRIAFRLMRTEQLRADGTEPTVRAFSRMMAARFSLEEEVMALFPLTGPYRPQATGLQEATTAYGQAVDDLLNCFKPVK